MSIINDYLLKYAATDNVSGNGQYDLYIKELGNGSILKKARLLVVVILKSDSLFLAEIVNIVKGYQKGVSMPFRASCKIIISSPRGSIYLYETITDEEIWKANFKRNRTCVINSENGTICINPGHIKNAAFTERLKALIEEYRYMNGLVFEREIFTLFTLCIDNL